MSVSLKSTLTQRAQKLAQQKGLRLYDLECSHPGLLKVLLDRDSGEELTLEDCADFSRSFSPLLDDLEDSFKSSYRLEVSSPGVERPLKQQWHFQESLGKRLQIKTFQPISAAGSSLKSFQGRLTHCQDGEVDILVEIKGALCSCRLKIENIAKAWVVFFEEEKYGRSG